MHQKKVQKEKLKVVKARLNFEEVSSERGSDLDVSAACPEVLNQGAADPSMSRTTSVAEILKVVTKVPAQEEQNSLLRNTITKEHPHARRKHCQKVKVVQEDTRSHGQKIKDQALRMTTYPSHGCARKLICSLPQKKCIKDPVEIHHIKQREGESIEDFMHRFKIESRDVKGAPKVMRISGGEVAAGNQERKKSLPPWKQQEAGHKQNFKKGGFKNQHRSERRQDKFTLLSKSPKEILALEKGKFKTPPPMTTSVEKRNNNKFYEFQGEVGYNTDECMQLKRKIEELLKNGKLSHRVARQRITQSFFPDPEISFPPLEEEEGTEGPMIIKAEIGGHFIHRMYVDGGLASKILYKHCFNRLRPEIKNQMVPATAPLIGFSGEIIWPLGQISLLVKIGDEKHSTSAWMNFVIVRSSSPYNGIIGRPGVRKIQSVSSTAHGMLKFPVAGGILTLKSSRIIPIKCAAVLGPEGQPPAAHQAIEERIKVAINLEYTEQTIMNGSTLTEEGRNKLCDLLQRNLDVFAWKPADMTGIPRHIAEHRLNIKEGCPPIRQKRRGQAADKNQAIQEEVEKLVDAGIIKEVHYQSWLSNLVMVKKHDGSWRMCVDFKDLNKACPKNGYPLPERDWKVESLCGFPFKCFLDAYKGYHQIKMAKEDEEKTTFITIQGIFCYSKMPFGLRNVGATYQRLVDKAFHKQIGRNLEVYVDDLVIKNRTKDKIIRDIEETFKTLREINMKLNPKKCTFGVEEGMFLGYKVNTKGIKLNGKLAILNMFLAKSAEKSLPFFKTLKMCTKKSDFHWTEEAESAFKQMKQLIAKLPTLTAPEEKDELIVYLAAAKEAVSAVLMIEREAKQMPIYFVSRALRGPKVNYISMGKLVLALVHASKRLKRYFQAHPIIVITDQPIKQVLSRPEVAGRPQKWSIEGFSGHSNGGRIRTSETIDFVYERIVLFEATNNEAEYEALNAGLRIAKEMGVKNLQANVDSILVANQVNETYIAKEADMIRYLEKVRTFTNGLKIKQVLVEELKEKSINELEVLAVVEEEGDTWMTPIYEYLTEETLPAEGIDKGMPRLPGRPFPEGPGKVKFLIVAIDYFTKRIEAKPVATITANQVKKIVWDNIVCRFGLPGEIISDKGKQLVERANRSLGEGIKARLDVRNKNWMEEISHVLWAHRTMIKSSNEDTPFSLTYGTEAVIPTEIGMPTLRTAEVDMVQNDEALDINLDLLEERRE
ncbi:reverse transcriptase domain-containing protein [Tanacetum coccineum]